MCKESVMICGFCGSVVPSAPGFCVLCGGAERVVQPTVEALVELEMWYEEVAA